MDKAIDYRNWGISLSRRFRSLKLWFTIRSYGVAGIQKYIRHHVALAKKFEMLIRADNRFEIFGQVSLGLVCFYLKGPEILSKNLLFLLNNSGDIHMTPTIVNDRYIIRFCVNAPNPTEDDINASWQLIKEAANKTFLEYHQKSNPYDSVDENCSENSNMSINYLRRKTITRLTSEPAKQTHAVSLMSRKVVKSSTHVKDHAKSLDELQEDESDMSLHEN
jgi:aromatic-L-amino-acid decarboxylase